jgi:hypothetical protein
LLRSETGKRKQKLHALKQNKAKKYALFLFTSFEIINWKQKKGKEAKKYFNFFASRSEMHAKQNIFEVKSLHTILK